MNETLSQKIAQNKFFSQMQITNTNLCKEDFSHRNLDGIISSVIIHHIEDVPKLFQVFFSLLKSGGFIAIADLESEDGTFHKEDMGVFHLGFDKDELLSYVKEAGFIHLEIQTISIARKAQREYPIFLLTGKKPLTSS